MIKKNILVITLAISLLSCSSAIVYASQYANNSTKNTLKVAYDSNDVKSDTAESREVISDEKAIQMATKAMEEYMGKPADYFTATKVLRMQNLTASNTASTSQNADIPEETKKALLQVEKYMADHPEVADATKENKAEIQNNPVITVWFTPVNLDQNKLYSNFVNIKERTGEIVNVTAINGLERNWEGKVNDVKVKKAALDYFKSIGKSIDENSILIKNDNGALSIVDFKLSDGRSGSLEVSLQDFSVVHYEVRYLNLKPVPKLSTMLTE